MAVNPKKPAPGGRMEEVQRRAQAMANRKPVAPKQFFEEAWIELKKTSWPSRPVLFKSTTVVLALVLAVAIWVGALDSLFTQIMGRLFNLK